MKTVAFKDIREQFSDVANQVNYTKEYYMLTKNNKPMVAIVPPEAMQLLAEIFSASKESKQIAQILEKYMLTISKQDLDFLKEMLDHPPKPNEKLLNASLSARRKINPHNQ